MKLKKRKSLTKCSKYLCPVEQAKPTTYLEKREYLTQKLLKDLLHYDPEVGKFTWVNPRAKAVKTGDVAGSQTKEGYVNIKLGKFSFKAHRLAVFYMTGYWPKSGDHRNGVRWDNRWSNIRPSTHAENCRNKIVRNSTGFSGVSREKRWGLGYRARITHPSGRREYLGSFKSAEEASAAVEVARASCHGEFSVTKSRAYEEVVVENIAD